MDQDGPAVVGCPKHAMRHIVTQYHHHTFRQLAHDATDKAFHPSANDNSHLQRIVVMIYLGKNIIRFSHMMDGSIAQTCQMFHYLILYRFLFHCMQIFRNHLQIYIIPMR